MKGILTRKQSWRRQLYCEKKSEKDLINYDLVCYFKIEFIIAARFLKNISTYLLTIALKGSLKWQLSY